MAIPVTLESDATDNAIRFQRNLPFKSRTNWKTIRQNEIDYHVTVFGEDAFAWIKSNSMAILFCYMHVCEIDITCE